MNAALEGILWQTKHLPFDLMRITNGIENAKSKFRDAIPYLYDFCYYNTLLDASVEVLRR